MICFTNSCRLCYISLLTRASCVRNGPSAVVLMYRIVNVIGHEVTAPVLLYASVYVSVCILSFSFLRSTTAY